MKERKKQKEFFGLNRCCPFCGGSDLIVERCDGNANLLAVFCESNDYECQAEGPARRTPDEAIEAWNTRKEQSLIPQNCTRLMQLKNLPYPKTCPTCGIFGSCRFGLDKLAGDGDK